MGATLSEMTFADIRHALATWRAIAVYVFGVGSVLVMVGSPYAQEKVNEWIDQRVKERMDGFERAIDQNTMQVGTIGTQLATQQESLRNIEKSLERQDRNTELILRALTRSPPQ